MMVNPWNPLYPQSNRFINHYPVAPAALSTASTPLMEVITLMCIDTHISVNLGSMQRSNTSGAISVATWCFGGWN
jgi:hypothetical protein